MSQAHGKQLLVIEAIRKGFEGDDAVDFIRRSGFAMTQAGIARHLRALGGRGRVFELISEGLSNEQVLQRCLPQDQDLQRLQIPPNQPELFLDDEKQTVPLRRPRETVFDTTKITLTVPSELFQAIRLAAHAERKSKADLIIEILTRELSRTPRFEEEAGGEETL